MKSPEDRDTRSSNLERLTCVQLQKPESSDEEPGMGSRQQRGGKDLHAKPEELDASSLDPSEAGKKFRKAEKRQFVRCSVYYPSKS